MTEYKTDLSLEDLNFVWFNLINHFFNFKFNMCKFQNQALPHQSTCWASSVTDSSIAITQRNNTDQQSEKNTALLQRYTSESSTSGRSSLAASKSIGPSARVQRVDWMQASMCSFRNGTTLAGFKHLFGRITGILSLKVVWKHLLKQNTFLAPCPASCRLHSHHWRPHCRCGGRFATHPPESLQKQRKPIWPR